MFRKKSSRDIKLPKSLLAQGLKVFLLAALLTGCATTRRGTQGWVILPTSMEIGVGQGVVESVNQEYPTYKDPGINRYIQGLGQAIVGVCDRRDIEYRFTVLDTPVVNAFAAPGGFVFITTGLLKAADNEAEVVAVMGHEVGHVVARHGAQRIQAQYGLSLAAQLAGLDKKSELFQGMVGVGVNLALQGYSRENELEADHYGALYASRLGYDPRGEVTFFEKLGKLEKKSPSILEKWMASHPPTEDRIQEFNKNTGELPSLSGKLNAKEYLTAVAVLKKSK